jgi:hypothetical protein
MKIDLNKKSTYSHIGLPISVGDSVQIPPFWQYPAHSNKKKPYFIL